MKIKIELFGASRDLSNKDFLELNLKNKSSIKDLRETMIHYVDQKFKGNENYKKIIKTSAFCSEDNNIVSENYQITKDQKIGIIPPIGGGSRRGYDVPWQVRSVVAELPIHVGLIHVLSKQKSNPRTAPPTVSSTGFGILNRIAGTGICAMIA